MSGFSIEDDEFIAMIPEWVTYLEVQRLADGWHAMVCDDAYWKGKSSLAHAISDTPAHAVEKAVYKADRKKATA